MKNSARWSLIFVASCSGSILYTKPKRVRDLPPPPPPLVSAPNSPGNPTVSGGPDGSAPDNSRPPRRPGAPQNDNQNPGPDSNHRPISHNDSNNGDRSSAPRNAFNNNPKPAPEGYFVADEKTTLNLAELFFADRKIAPNSKDPLDSVVDGLSNQAGSYKVRIRGVHSRESQQVHNIEINLDIVSGKQRLHLATNQDGQIVMSSGTREARQNLNATLRGVNTANETIVLTLRGELKEKGWVIDVINDNEKIGTIFIDRI
ncbi:MAG: hypothetical protein KA116_01390 [Proteobacteria bacterium]|nr:hypothetical protein [Pseudomonadota bacterium]